MEQRLRFIITGDTSGLDNASKKAEATLKKLNSQIDRLQKELAENIRISQGYEGAIKRLDRELKKGTITQEEYRRSYDRLQRDQKETIQDTKRLRSEITRLTRDQRTLNKSIVTSGRSFSSLGRSVGNLGAAFGITSGVFLFARAIQGAARSVVEFDKSMVTLASVLGTTRDEITSIEDEIKEVSATSVNTANDVAKLANSLATLGKTEREIRNLLGPVNNLSIALQASADQAGELLVQTLNAFGEGSQEAQRFADVIAKMRTSTSLDFQRIRVSLSYLAPAAKAAGISFEESGALLGVLSDNGIRASRAGRLLASSLSRLTTNGITLEQALDRINASTNKQVTATELFGTESFSLGLILADNTTRVSELTDEFDRAAGSLQKLTDDQLTTVSARFKLTQSAWENFVLSIENGEGVISTALKNLADEWAETFNIFAQWANPVTALDQLRESTQKTFDELGNAQGIGVATKQIEYFTKQVEEMTAAQEKLSNTPTAGMNPRELQDSIDEMERLGESIEDYQSRIEFLNNFIKKNPIEAPDIIEPEGGGGEGTERGKQYAKNFNEGLKSEGITPLDTVIETELISNTDIPTAGIDEYIAKMQQAQEVSGIFASATSSALGALGNEIAVFFETGNSVIDAFVGSIIDSLAQIAASYISNLITQKIIAQKTIQTEQAKSNANAITIASSAAAALGPFGAVALPGLIATQLALINGAFAGIQAIGAFAQGGPIGGGSFTGDKVPILANSGEYVLTAQDQGYLTNFLRGNTGGTTNAGGAVTVTGRIEAEGSKLVTVISNTQRRSNRLGGSMKL